MNQFTMGIIQNILNFFSSKDEQEQINQLSSQLTAAQKTIAEQEAQIAILTSQTAELQEDNELLAEFVRQIADE